MKYTYHTKSTCNKRIDIEVENGILMNVIFYGGCNGNLQGISKLVSGMSVETVIAKLEGIKCGSRPTSCPDQLCEALKQMDKAQLPDHKEDK